MTATDARPEVADVNAVAEVASAVPAISVVVCTYRRAEKLPACLDALARQTIRDRVEVIVVDDGPDDATAAVAARYDVRLVRHSENRGLAAARNTGIAASTAPIVAFTDDDCVPAEDWLEALLEPYDKPDVVAVGGRVEALRHETLVHRYLAETDRLAPLEIELSVSSSLAYRAQLYLRRNWRSAGPRPGTRPVYSIVGANMSFRRDALIEIGMFDPRISFGGEDEDICRRLRERPTAEHFLFTSRAVIAHDFDGELRDTLRRSFQYGAGSARGYLKNEDQGPTLFPVPALVAALALLGLRRRWALAGAVAVPLLVFSRWPVAAARTRRAELLAFPAVQLCEETAHDLGFLKSWLRLRREYRRRPTGEGVGR
jgi:glycosyltransferase involved in cell wall biosynthesis